MKARSQVKRRDDRQAAKLTLLNRARRITHILSGIPTGKDAWTVDDHRQALIGADRRAPPGPTITPARRAELQAARAEGRRAAPPTAAESAAWSLWRSQTPTVTRSSAMADSLPESYGVDPMDRITHQQIANQAAKAVSALESCGHWRGVYSCPSHGAWAATARCGHRLCVPCAVVRRSELLKRYGPWLSTNDTPDGPRVPMVTCTQVSIDGEDLAVAFARLQERHRAFTRAVRAELAGTSCTTKAAIKEAKRARQDIGGLSSLEATARPGRRWNAHVHILLREPAKGTVPDEWTVPHWRKQPLNPWRLRLLWATALLDGRTTADAEHLAELRQAYRVGRDAWRRKMRARTRKTRARKLELVALRAWRQVCLAADVPAIVDLKSVHPAEGLKYLTKGFDLDPSRGAPVTDWHLAQLLVGTYYLRRTVPWGSLYRLPKATCGQVGPDGEACGLAPAHQGEHKAANGATWPRQDGDECAPGVAEDDGHRACPHCGADSAPLVREAWRGSGAVPDSVLTALRLDGLEFRPRPPPGGALRALYEAPQAPPGAREQDPALVLALGECLPAPRQVSPSAA